MKARSARDRLWSNRTGKIMAINPLTKHFACDCIIIPWPVSESGDLQLRQEFVRTKNAEASWRTSQTAAIQRRAKKRWRILRRSYCRFADRCRVNFFSAGKILPAYCKYSPVGLNGAVATLFGPWKNPRREDRQLGPQQAASFVAKGAAHLLKSAEQFGHW